MAHLNLLGDLVVLFAAALVVVLVLRRLRLPTIAGFLVAGALIGPSGFGWIGDVDEIESLAEIGVVLLLFTIGLEFSFKRIVRLKKLLVSAGTTQVVATSVAVGYCNFADYGSHHWEWHTNQPDAYQCTARNLRSTEICSRYPASERTCLVGL